MTDTTDLGSTDDRPDPATMAYEDAVAELETIIRRIEDGEIGLEATLVEWRRGGALLKRCSEVLDVAEQEFTAAQDVAGD